MARFNSSTTPYIAWNDAIAAKFFHAGVAGQQVYLYVTEEVIDEVGRSFDGGGVPEFLEAVRAGPGGVTRSGLCQRALQVAREWRQRGFHYPPYVAYLALFVLAAGHEGDFAAHAYYPRLRELLGEAGEGSPPSFERMLELWDDLERWSTQDHEGELGIFEARIVGEWIHVGLPLAQTILTGAERAALPTIFFDAGLEPGQSLSIRDLQRAMVQSGRSALRPRTIRAIERGTDTFRAALLDVVADEFLEWDGGKAEGADSERRGFNAGLRLCISVDRVARTAEVSVRCHSRQELPEAGLALDGTVGVPLRCVEYLPDWSAPLMVVDAGGTYRPAAGVWASGMVLTDREQGWTLRLRSARIRVFEMASGLGLPGLIEAPNVPLGRPFYLALPASDWPALHDWADHDCGQWKELGITSGLPNGWTLIAIDEAHTDAGPRLLDPDVAVPDRVSLRLVGGVRTSAAGSSYFDFALPSVSVAGTLPGDVVTCNGIVVHEDRSSPGRYHLPEGLPSDSRAVIQVLREGQPATRSVSLFVVSGFPWRSRTPMAHFDGMGRLLNADFSEGNAITGAIAPPPVEPLPYDLLRTPGLQTDAPRIYFIGSSPGEIATWPAEPIPDWHPTWAIPMRRHGRAIFCGTPHSVAQRSKRAGSDPGRTALWQQVMWQWRKRIAPPKDPGLLRLWRQHQEAARDA